MWWKWLLAALPPVACLGLALLPGIDAAHLWAGLPSLLWWTAGFGVVAPMLIMLLWEWRRAPEEDDES